MILPKILSKIHRPWLISTCILQRAYAANVWPTSSTGITNYLSKMMIPDDKLKKDCQSIFESGVQSVLPRAMIENNLKIKDNILKVEDREYELKQNVHVVAFGKAVIGMCRAVDDLLREHIVRGIASVPTGIQETFTKHGKRDFLLEPGSKIEVFEGAKNNLPDANSHSTAMKIHKHAQSLKESDLLLVLISGGGSALLPAPIPPITLEEKASATKQLAKAGATIQELNTVRKHLSLLKGGGLAKAAFPAQVVSLILSDVIGDPLGLIASAPTVQDTSTALQCRDLLRKLQIEDSIPSSIVKQLEKEQVQARDLQASGQMAYQAASMGIINQEQQVELDSHHVQNLIVGSNSIAVQAAKKTATDLGYMTMILSTTLEGEAQKVGIMLARLAKFICLSHGNKIAQSSSNKELINSEISLFSSGIEKSVSNELARLAAEACTNDKPICVICAGETTVQVRGQGKGGRNQEMALAMAVEMNEVFQLSKVHENYHIQFLSAGTDGQDGPTEATGAFVDPSLYQRAEREGLNTYKYLNENDSFNFFQGLSKGADHYITGHTGTNVMDLQVLLIKPLKSKGGMR